MDVDPAFKAEGVEKLGPHGGRLRWERGNEWKVFETLNGQEIEISADDIKYYQDVDGKKEEVSPFDATKLWDILASRNIEETGFDPDKSEVSLGALIPREKVDEFGPDKEKGSSMYWITGDAFGLRALVEKLEKEKAALYFPLVFRRRLTIHLCVLYPVRLGGNVYLIMRTFGGTTIWSKPLDEKTAYAAVEKKIEVMAKPILRRKPAGVN